jgi:hypothetical protein
MGRSAYKVLLGNHEGKNHWDDMDIDGRTTLKWIVNT